VPERWVPERILRGHLAGARVAVDLARCGDTVVLTGPELPDGPLVCRVDRHGPGATALDEPLAQAACGLMAVLGWGRGRRAARLGVDYVTTSTGVALAQGVLAGLLARLRAYPTRGVTVSMAATALLAVSPYLAAGTTGTPDPPARLGSGHPPPFRSADGVAFEIETLYAEPWRALWNSLGVPDTVAGRAWRPFMQRYTTAVAPLPAALHAATEARPFTEVASAAAAAGVAVQRLRRHAERREELASNKPFTAPWTLQPPAPPPPPRHGDISGSNGSRSARYVSMSGSGGREAGEGPLAGMVVVDAGRRVQAPLTAHLLGLLGAQVIRIEPTGGDSQRVIPPMAGDCSARFLAFNHGKQVIEADLWNPAGRRTVLDAAAAADVFVHNWVPGKAAQLGLDHNHLAAVNPRLISAHASGWGEARGAHPLPGTDYLVQAYTGLAEYLTPVGEAPAGSLMPLLDVLGGLLTTSGVLAGLLGRERDGRGRRVRSSLLSAAALLQAQLGGSRRSNGQPEFGPFGVPLPAPDGDLVISRTAPASAVTAALELDHPAEVPAKIAAQPIDRSLELLTAAGIDAVRACHHPAELAGESWAASLLHHDRCALVRPPWSFTA
jgi:crotonobetainyl-CoA:carnitine CoA-transferase CaiB-like acyl-CoA transferase